MFKIEKKYVVIEYNAYMFYAGVKFFDNLDDASNYYYEAVNDFELDATLGSIKVIKEHFKNKEDDID